MKTLKEYAKEQGISLRTAHRRIKSGEIKVIKKKVEIKQRQEVLFVIGELK